MNCQDKHSMRCVGYLHGTRPLGLDCQKPLDMACDTCGLRAVWRCGNHRASACTPCATRYRRMVRFVAYSGVSQKGHSRGTTYLATFTSPSNIGQHCYSKKCRSRDGSCAHEKCPCTPPGGIDLAVWNRGCGKAWNRLRTSLRREYPGLEFFRAVEVQDGKRVASGVGRGALHLHVIVWAPDGMGSLASVRRLAIAAGYGHSVDLERLSPNSRKASYYVSKYVSKACDSNELVPWHLTRVRVPERPAVPDPDKRAAALAVRALGDSAAAAAGRFGWGALPVVEPIWDPTERIWVQLLDDDGDDWRAWSPVEYVHKANHRNWSRSKDWGVSMAAVKARSAAYAAGKAAEAREAADGWPATGGVPALIGAGQPPDVPW